MSFSTLVRRSGLGAAVGGVLGIILSIVDATLSDAGVEEVTGSTWLISQALWILVLALFALGLVGAYLHQAKQAGTLGLVGFLVAFLGTSLLMGAQWGAAFMAPWIGEEAPQLLEIQEPEGAFAIGFILSILLLGVGWLLFGLATQRAGVIQRAVPLALMVGAVLFLALDMLEVPFSGAVLSVAVGWMGYVLWSGTAETAT